MDASKNIVHFDNKIKYQLVNVILKMVVLERKVSQIILQ